MTFVGDLILIAVFAGPDGNVAHILHTVGVAVFVGIALVRDLVSVAIRTCALGNVAFIRNLVGVAVVTPFLPIATTVAIVHVEG